MSRSTRTLEALEQSDDAEHDPWLDESPADGGRDCSRGVTPRLRGPLVVVALVGALIATRDAAAQQLGYKVLGAVGITAGVESPPGLFVMSRIVQFGAGELRSRDGRVAPIAGLDIDAFAAVLGAAYTMKLDRGPYLTVAVGLPYANLHLNSDEPAASLSDYGFADMFVQPLKLGLRRPRYDVVTSWAVYIPTGRYEPRSRASVGKGHWTNQFSLGGAAFFDSTRTRLVSALASYELNTRNRGIDIRRGDTFQIQGGVGVGVAKLATVGVAGYALWQTTPDHGTQIPPTLRDQRARVFGLGPEIGVTIPAWRLRADARLEQDFGVTSRLNGRVLHVGVTYLAWTPVQGRSAGQQASAP